MLSCFVVWYAVLCCVLCCEVHCGVVRRAVFVTLSLLFHFTFDYYDIYTDHILSNRNAIMIDLFGLLIVSASYSASPNVGWCTMKVNKKAIHMNIFDETLTFFFSPNKHVRLIHSLKWRWKKCRYHLNEMKTDWCISINYINIWCILELSKCFIRSIVFIW